MFFPLILFLALGLPQSSSNAPKPDALALLNEVSQRYADAKSYHIEAVEERTTSSELRRHWDKTLYTAIVMADGRYRYEGRSAFGSAILMSDGITQWGYHPVEHIFTQRPASGGDLQAGRTIPPEEMPAFNGRNLFRHLSHKADRVKSAAFLPDEMITVNGKNVDCFVVRYSDEPSKHNDVIYEWTLWIDKSRKVIVKTFSQGTTYSVTMARGRIPSTTEETVIYTVVELNQQEPASSFVFVPPADANLVAEFPNYFARNQQTSEPVDRTGKPAPELQLKAADGKVTALSSFHGQPVFIEFWATWCVPCVELFPELKRLHAETATKGLAWIGIDSDEGSIAPAAFLSRERVAWPNYHDEGGSFGQAFHRQGIPLGVLINADGKIVFYKLGYKISDLRSAVAALGPQFGLVAAGTTSSK